MGWAPSRWTSWRQSSFYLLTYYTYIVISPWTFPTCDGRKFQCERRQTGCRSASGTPCACAAVSASGSRCASPYCFRWRWRPPCATVRQTLERFSFRPPGAELTKTDFADRTAGDDCFGVGQPFWRDRSLQNQTVCCVSNSSFRLFGRIRIVLWTIRPNKNTNTNSVGGRAFWRCTCCSDIYHLLMSLANNYGRACILSRHDPLPFIRLPY